MTAGCVAPLQPCEHRLTVRTDHITENERHLRGNAMVWRRLKWNLACLRDQGFLKENLANAGFSENS